MSCKLSPAICMKLKNLFSWKNKRKYLNMSSAEEFMRSAKL